eukprot:8530971-Prorocentrum_lima.AAC.1
MTSSLVGSEMCIRDSLWTIGYDPLIENLEQAAVARCPTYADDLASHAVSYTHLTLPTICSV